MASNSEIEQSFEDRAMEGDGRFAIALALLHLASAQKELARHFEIGINDIIIKFSQR